MYCWKFSSLVLTTSRQFLLAMFLAYIPFLNLCCTPTYSAGDLSIISPLSVWAFLPCLAIVCSISHPNMFSEPDTENFPFWEVSDFNHSSCPFNNNKRLFNNSPWEIMKLFQTEVNVHNIRDKEKQVHKMVMVPSKTNPEGTFEMVLMISLYQH